MGLVAGFTRFEAQGLGGFQNSQIIKIVQVIDSCVPCMMDYAGSCRIKTTLATAIFFSIVGFQDSCDLLARPLGHAITVNTKNVSTANFGTECLIVRFRVRHTGNISYI